MNAQWEWGEVAEHLLCTSAWRGGAGNPMVPKPLPVPHYSHFGHWDVAEACCLPLDLTGSGLHCRLVQEDYQQDGLSPGQKGHSE